MATSIKVDVLAIYRSGAFKCVLIQCQGGKTSALILAIVAPCQSGKGHEPIFKQFEVYNSIVRMIIHSQEDSSLLSINPGMDIPANPP